MTVSGFTIVRNARRYNYPVLESIQSILPVCDECIVNVGDSDDDTLALIESINDPKIKIIRNVWDFGMGKEVLSHQTNLALEECSGDWAFYLQSDEVIHEEDLPRIQQCMRSNLSDEAVDALRFKWFHFYGSYNRYRIDKGWYQKQDRIIRNNGTVESVGDAFAFARKDGSPLRYKPTGAFLYHYGWVHPDEVMADRRKNAESIGFVTLKEEDKKDRYDYGDLTRFPAYFGSHPATMRKRIASHELTKKDSTDVRRQYWWHPLYWARARVKTGRRVKTKIE